MNLRYQRRKLVSRILMIVSSLMMAFSLFWLCWIFITLFGEGFKGITLDLFTKMTPPPGSPGGLLNAIFGSLMMVGVATAIGTPIGILAGTYLAEFGENNLFASVTRFINDILLSAPSIVIGLFIYQAYVMRFGSFAGWAGALALSIIVIPVVVRSTESMIKLVPGSLREAAFALGTPAWKTFFHITLKSVGTGVLTGVLLAVARISGETAPLLFTALNNQFWSADMTKPMANLPVVIFQYAMSPYDDWKALAWSGALLITLGVLTLNILARVLVRQQKSH